MFWTLLSKPFEGGSKSTTSTLDAKTFHDRQNNGLKSPSVKVRSNRPLKRNNQGSAKSKLSKPMNNAIPASDDVLNVDITIETNAIPIDSPQVRLNILVPLVQPTGYLNLTVAVLLNGQLAVTSTTNRLRSEEMAKQLTRVLELSEDLGVLVEWAIDRLRAV